MDAEDAKTYGRKFDVSPAWLLFGEDSVERSNRTEVNKDGLPLLEDPNMNATFLVAWFLLHWGILEQTLDEATQMLLKYSFIDTENLVYHLSFQQKTTIIGTTLSAYSKQLPELSSAKLALNDIQNMEKIRNSIAHGRFAGTKDLRVKLAPSKDTPASTPRETTWSKTDFQERCQRIQQHTKTITMCVNALVETLSERDVEQPRTSVNHR